MDKLVKRVTLVTRSGDITNSLRVYEDPKENKRGKVSGWARPFERAARKLMKSEIAFAEEMIRRSDRSNRPQRDGWMFDAPVIVFRSGRAAYNQARKAVPFGLMPKF
jgi:hypothetical protein